MSGYFLCSPSVSQTLRKAKANHLVKMWYGFSLFVLSVVCFSFTSLVLFTCDVLMLVICAVVSPLFQEEVPLPTASRTLEEEMAAAASQSVEKEAPSDGITEEVSQPMQGIQAIQDPETFELPASQGPQIEQTPNLIKTVLPQMGSSTKTLGGASPSRQMGELYSFIIMFNPISFVSPFSLPFLSFFFFSFFLFPFQAKPV